jgi:hypothetical protein
MLASTNHNEEIFMKRFFLFVAGLMAIVGGLAGCANMDQSGWTTLVDGTNMDQWSPIGDANWRVADGTIVGDKGNGFLVSKNSYTDFEIRAEFWADADANSGIFLRCADRTKVTAENAYEVNIFDKRPDPTYGTGAIVNVAKIGNMIKAAGQWNTYEIIAKGPVFTVTLNGVRTVDGARDAKLASGPIALQSAGGTIKFRKVQIRPL